MIISTVYHTFVKQEIVSQVHFGLVQKIQPAEVEQLLITNSWYCLTSWDEFLYLQLNLLV